MSQLLFSFRHYSLRIEGMHRMPVVIPLNNFLIIKLSLPFLNNPWSPDSIASLAINAQMPISSRSGFVHVIALNLYGIFALYFSAVLNFLLYTKVPNFAIWHMLSKLANSNTQTYIHSRTYAHIISNGFDGLKFWKNNNIIFSFSISFHFIRFKWSADFMLCH